MDYFILKTKLGGYWCVNSVVRCKDTAGKDVVTFVCSGIATTMDIDQIVGFFPTTPPPDWK
jgi:hypothetical protein